MDVRSDTVDLMSYIMYCDVLKGGCDVIQSGGDISGQVVMTKIQWVQCLIHLV